MLVYVDNQTLEVHQIGPQAPVFDDPTRLVLLDCGVLDSECVVADMVDDVITLSLDPSKVAAKGGRIKAELIQVKYDEMNADVYAQMLQVMGTNKPDSATAFYETWKLMTAKPELFSPEGLLDDAGNPLDTNQKVVEYAAAKIAGAEAYSVYRMTRIKQFKAEKAAILAQ